MEAGQLHPAHSASMLHGDLHSSPSSQVVGCDMCDVIVPLHTFRDDQKLVNDCIIKVFSPAGPVTLHSAHDSETPSHMSGLVRTRRVFVPPGPAEEHRELCSSDLFDTVLSMGGSLTGGSLMQGLYWFAQMAQTVAECHALGLVHGQLRPEHVLLSADGQSVKLLGFDPLSWRQLRFGPSIGNHHALRRAGLHDAPELAGRQHASESELAASDMWALGVLLTAILVEEPPVLAPSRAEIHWPRAVSLAPAPLQQLLASLLSLTPSERPSSAAVADHAQAMLASCAEFDGPPLEHAPQPPPFAPLIRANLPTCTVGGAAPHAPISPLASHSPNAHMSTASPSGTMERTESTLTASSADALPDDLSEAPTRASSLLELEESAHRRPPPSKCELLYEQLRKLEARQCLPPSGVEGAPIESS